MALKPKPKFKAAKFGKPGARVVAKIRRTKTEAYGTSDSWAVQSAMCLQLAGRRCSRCSRPSSPGNRLNAHHVIPVSRGGKTVQANLRCLCDHCHSLQPGHSHLRK